MDLFIKKEITINKLINHKEYRDNEYEYDILVTGINGEDALYGSGLNGEDGHNGGKVDITVLELDGSIHIKASGGNGGFGEKEEAVEFVQEASVLVVNREKKEPLADISEMVVMG